MNNFAFHYLSNLGLLFLFINVLDNEKDFRDVSILIVFIGILPLFLGATVEGTDGDRIVATLSSMFDTNALAFYVIVCMPFSLYLVATQKQIWIKIFGVIGFVILGSLVLRSGSRAGFIVVIIELILFVVFFGQRKGALPIAIVLGFLYLLFNANFLDMPLERLSRLQHGDGSWDVRVYMSHKAFELFAENPIIGVGTENARHVIWYRKDMNVHDTYTKILA